MILGSFILLLLYLLLSVVINLLINIGPWIFSPSRQDIFHSYKYSGKEIAQVLGEYLLEELSRLCLMFALFAPSFALYPVCILFLICTSVCTSVCLTAFVCLTSFAYFSAFQPVILSLLVLVHF